MTILNNDGEGVSEGGEEKRKEERGNGSML